MFGTQQPPGSNAATFETEIQMRRLNDFTKLIRSKNAGPFVITPDITLPGIQSYTKVTGTGVLHVDKIVSLYHMPCDQMKL